MQRPPHLQNVDPQRLFADPNYNPQGNKVSDQDFQAMQQRYKQFQPVQQAPAVQNFQEINNAQNFQVQNLQNDIDAMRKKLDELEKRVNQLKNPQQAHPQHQPLATQPVFTQQAAPQQQAPAQQQQGVPQFRAPQNAPQQVPQFQAPPQAVQQQPQQPPPVQGGFQPYRR